MIAICFVTAAYLIGGMLWFLINVFLKNMSLKRSFIQSLIWPYYHITMRRS